MKPFDYAIAKTEAAALAAMGQGYRPKAGGIDLLDLLKERIEPGEKFVSIALLRDSNRELSLTGGDLIIGPLMTLRQLVEQIDKEGLGKQLAAVRDCVANAATPQIRAVATVAGNLCQRPRCWYFRSSDYDCLKKGGGTCYAVDGDNRYHALFGGGPCHIVHPSNLAVGLMAVGGGILTKKAGGEGRFIPIDDFFVLPKSSMYAENVLEADELIVEISASTLTTKSAYVDYKERQAFDWPLASCAVAWNRIDKGWRVVLGAVAPIPWRAKKAEELLAGKEAITVELAEAAAEAALDGAAPMTSASGESNAWRLRLVRSAVRDALLTADGKDIA